jgi:hypothetical protein
MIPAPEPNEKTYEAIADAIDGNGVSGPYENVADLMGALNAEEPTGSDELRVETQQKT